jgi:hypothetical protein
MTYMYKFFCVLLHHRSTGSLITAPVGTIDEGIPGVQC